MGSLRKPSILKGKNVCQDTEATMIHKIFQSIQSTCPKQIALLYEDDSGEEYSVSYEDLERTTNKISRTLRSCCEMRKDSPSIIAVSMKPTHRLPIVLLSILKSGMAYLPLDVEFPPQRVKHILEESQPLLVIIDEGDKSIYERTPVATYNQLQQQSQSQSSEALCLQNDPEQLAIVLYTSGSTGVPKGVQLPHATVINRLQWQWQTLPYRDDEEKSVFKTALTFVDSVPEIWAALLRRRTLVIVPKHVTKDPAKFLDTLEKHKIQRLVVVPSLLQSILMYLNLRDNDNSLRLLRLWICSGETLSVTLAKEFFAIFHKFGHILANFYGSTEVMGDVTYCLLNNPQQLENMEKIPIGQPLDNCIVYLVNEDLHLVSQGEIGELIVAGRNLASGYIRGRDPHRFVDNPHEIDPKYSTVYRTGDYARITKGTIIYEGRKDSQIKVRGHRVDLAEVERSVATAPAVDEAVVLCYKPGEMSQALVSFLTIKNGATISGLQIENYLRSQLPKYMIPQVIIIDSIPRLINGKTDRQTLLKMYETSNLNGHPEQTVNCDYTALDDDQLEKAKVLFPTVASVIGRSGRFTVDGKANFYDLGGNSLNSIYTVTKLKEQGYHIGITDFLTAKSMIEILCRMTRCSENLQTDNNDGKFIVETVNNSHREAVSYLITESFYLKADLERWLAPDIKRSDYYDLMDVLWLAIVEKAMSFVLRSATDNHVILGVCLSFDAFDEPECTVTSKLAIVFEFLEYLERPIRETKLPQGKGKILHCYMMATNPDLTPAENVIIMNKMEEECLNFARERNFVGIFTTNTSPLTQQLDMDVYGYEALLDYQVNQYVMPDGTRPFAKAPDSQRAVCAWKEIQQ